MTSYGDIKDNEQECIANATLVSVTAKRFSPGNGHSADLDQKRSCILLATIDHESIVPWNAQKAKEVENYLYTSVPMVLRLKLFFAQSLLSIRSVSTEQSEICVKSTVSVKQAQGDLLWQRNPTHFSRQQTC